MNLEPFTANRRWVRLIVVLLLPILLLLTPAIASSQGNAPVAGPTLGAPAGAAAPLFWYVLATAIALLVPTGFVLIGVAGLEPQRAWNAALGAVGAIGLAGLVYWAVGFALQFGGVGLTYLRPELRNLVWEWSPLPPDWGIGWGAAGLAGWFLSGSEITGLGYALFLSHLPWVFTAALLPVMALRGRAPAVATLLLALFLGGLVYPLAGNWVQGGGWLSALGRNLSLGHGFVDAGGAGTVFLLAAAFSTVALAVWAPRRRELEAESALPPSYQPLLTVIGTLLIVAGVLGWLWSNPLQVMALSDLALLRGSVNVVLAAVGGVLVPLLYTWFVAGASDPSLSARGLAAGAVAGLAVAPFVQPGPALLVGLLAGATVPFMSYIVDHLLRLDDTTGVLVTAGMPAMIGLLLMGIFADGAAGAGWQLAGIGSYLGVAGQGVSGLLIAEGFQRDFPSQLQAQVIGVVAIGLWGFLSGLIVCVPLGLLFHGLQRSAEHTAPATASPTATTSAEMTPSPETGQSSRLFR